MNYKEASEVGPGRSGLWRWGGWQSLSLIAGSPFQLAHFNSYIGNHHNQSPPVCQALDVYYFFNPQDTPTGSAYLCFIGKDTEAWDLSDSQIVSQEVAEQGLCP